MSVFFQVLFINLAVSCDNVGVIALSSRGLPDREAKLASRLGIGLSLILKLVFIGIVGFLLQISWLHIRIIGGILLIYVTHNMLKESSCKEGCDEQQETKDRLLLALVSIIATDISMSLDNVIAILSIVTADGSTPGPREYMIILTGLLVCVPILLFFSQAISKLMERFPVLTYLCAGYLFYTAVNMIFEDESISLFLESIHFTITAPAAVFAGGMVVAGSIYINHTGALEKAHMRRRLTRIYVIGMVDALITIMILSYLNANFTENEILHSSPFHYLFTPQGANAVYTIGRSPHLVALCACLIASIVMEGNTYHSLSAKAYRQKLLKACKVMTAFLFIDVLTAGTGLTLLFGFGELHLIPAVSYLFMQLLLFLSYTAVFCMFKIFIKKKSIMLIVSMICVHIEIELTELFIALGSWPMLSGYMPGRFTHQLAESVYTVDFTILYRILLCSGIFLLLSVWIGSLYCRIGKKNL